MGGKRTPTEIFERKPSLSSALCNARLALAKFSEARLAFAKPLRRSKTGTFTPFRLLDDLLPGAGTRRPQFKVRGLIGN